MLRIVPEGGPPRETRLRLHGRVVGPWVEELHRVCTEVLSGSHRLSLDLGEVSFLDRQGVQLVLALGARRDVALVNCSGFVAEQLRAGRPARGQAEEGRSC
jgi:hypothetical protein